jgi:hydroxypyruvate isomerase
MDRREFLAGVAAAPLAMAIGNVAPSAAAQSKPAAARRMPIRQSVMASVWTGTKYSFEERCQFLSKLGFKGVDLPTREQIPILKKYGLTPTMMTGTGTTFQDGLIRKELHAKFEPAIRAGIDMCVEVGCPNLIALPGERRGMSREEGAEHAAAILSKVKGYAEEKGVNLCMEITNSKVAADQRTDQVFDRIEWGWDVCRRVNSPRMKIVYDIYHVQIMNGDIVRTITSATFTWLASPAVRKSTTRRSSITGSSPMPSPSRATTASSRTSGGPDPGAMRSKASSSASQF